MKSLLNLTKGPGKGQPSKEGNFQIINTKNTKLPQLTQHGIDNVNNPIISEEIEFAIKP